jgi:hypothetical protein
VKRSLAPGEILSEFVEAHPVGSLVTSWELLEAGCRIKQGQKWVEVWRWDARDFPRRDELLADELVPTTKIVFEAVPPYQTWNVPPVYERVR